MTGGRKLLETALIAGTEPWTIVHLHGTGGDEHQLEQLAAEVAPGATRIGVRGDVLEGGTVRRYFARHGDGVLDLADLARSADAIGTTLRAVLEEHDLLDGPVVGIGFSNGANALAAVHARRPSLLAGSVLLRPMWDGSFGDAAAPLATGRADGDRASVLALSGRADPYHHEGAMDALGSVLAPLGVDLTERVLPAGHGPTRADMGLAAEFLGAHRPAAAASRR